MTRTYVTPARDVILAQLEDHPARTRAQLKLDTIEAMVDDFQGLPQVARYRQKSFWMARVDQALQGLMLTGLVACHVDKAGQVTFTLTHNTPEGR